MSKSESHSWEEAILDKIQTLLSMSLGLADDPDNILSGDILLSLERQGVNVVHVSTPFVLRFEYETRFRQQSSSQRADLSTLFVPDFSLVYAPYDIQKRASIVSLSLSQFFPSLSQRVLRPLPVAWRSVLYQNQAHLSESSGAINDAETAKHVVQYCLGLDTNTITNIGELLALLTEVALRNLEIPPIIQKYLIAPKMDCSFLPSLPQLLSVPAEARTYLQYLWRVFTTYAGQNVPTGIAESLAQDTAPFVVLLSENPASQDRMTRLLLENVTQPAIYSPEATPPAWMRTGIHYGVDETTALEHQLTLLEKRIPNEGASFETWSAFAQEWARWRTAYFRRTHSTPEVSENLLSVQQKISYQYEDWLESHYASLLQQPYLPYPTTVHQVLRFLAARYQPSPQQPLALVVMDGMSLEDWLIIRGIWNQDGLSWQIEERTILALVPTLTSVSRQALLSGKLPRHFAQSWLTTKHEEKLWRRFWNGQGIHTDNVGYIRGLGMTTMESETPNLEKLLTRPHLVAAVFVINTVDELVHHNLLGITAQHEQLRLWVQKHSYLRRLTARLLERFSSVIITSDHGHVEGTGIGDIPLSTVAEERALRARIFTDQAFDALPINPLQIFQWTNIGLPEEAAIYIPKGDGLFAKPSVSGISHGGASLEETIIPFVRITRPS